MTKWSISLDTIDSTISWHNLNIFHRLRQNIVFAVRDFTFHDALRRLPMAIDSRKLWRGFSQILFHSEGKEDFAKSVPNTEVIRQLRFTFASLKSNGYGRLQEMHLQAL